MKSFLKIAKYIWPYKNYVLLSFLFNLFSVIFSIASFALFIPVLEMLFKTTEIPLHRPEVFTFSVDSIKDNFYYSIGQLIEKQGDLTALVYLAFIIVGIFFLKNTFIYLARFFISPVRIGVVKDIRDSIYKKILILPLSYYSEKRKGDLISRITTDVQEIEHTVMTSIDMLVRDPIVIIGYLFLLVLFSPSLTVFVLLFLPVSGIIIGYIGRSLKRTSEKGQKKMGDILSIIEESISGLRIIKGFNATQYINILFKKENERWEQLLVRLYRKRYLASPISEVLGVFVVVIILWFGGRLVLSGDSAMKAAEFIVYLGVVSQLLPPGKSLTNAYYNLQKGAASIDRIQEVLQADEVIIEKPEAIRLSSFNNEIEFRNVSFKYENDFVLKNINLVIPKGKSIALVGPSGGGKSTLVDLLPRFHDCTEGEIFLDGIPLTDIKISDVRELMGIVSQETILFNGSVAQNIAFGKENESIEKIINAAKIANAHKFIENIENGYDANIGDRGTKLSGGQQQRISIARAVLKNPPILILDEATSALDTESERLVQGAIKNLMKNRTSIVIAHRLSTIQFVDEIIVIDEAKIVERGNHNELLKQKGLYFKLYEMQSFCN